MQNNSTVEDGVAPAQSVQSTLRVLHCVGHLLRGGIEKWLYQTLPLQLKHGLEHHILVRTAEEEAFTAAFREAGIPVLVCSTFANPFRYAKDLKELVKQHGPYDILHVHGSSYSGLLTLAFAGPLGISRKIIHSHNDVRPHLQQQSVVYGFYVHLLMKAYRLLSDCGFAASVLAAESMFGRDWKKRKHCELLYYGVDCTPFEDEPIPRLREKLGIPNGAFVIGHVGRFHEQKNHAFLVDVVDAAARLSPTVHCLLIGEGPLRSAIAAEILRRGLQAQFTFVPDTTKPSDYMISVMDCFVLPSLYEGLGIVVLEAQAAGLPCLISDRVPQEAIIDGLLTKALSLERTPTEWAKTLLAFRQVESRSREASVDAVRSSRFNLHTCVSLLRSHYFRITRG